MVTTGCELTEIRVSGEPTPDFHQAIINHAPLHPSGGRVIGLLHLGQPFLRHRPTASLERRRRAWRHDPAFPARHPDLPPSMWWAAGSRHLM
jgi:hypothetical protein